jgi:hypothetical protein
LHHKQNRLLEKKSTPHVISTAREKSLLTLIKEEVGWQQVEYVEIAFLPAIFQV